VGDEFDGLLSGGKPDANQWIFSQSFQALERKGEMGAALVVSDGMDFVDNDGVDGFQDFAAFLGSEKDVQRFGSGNENVRRALQHGASLGHESVAGTNRGADLRHQEPAVDRQALNFAEWGFEIGFDIVPERFEGRDIKNLSAVPELTCNGLAE
jgi:hypothetical protein